MKRKKWIWATSPFLLLLVIYAVLDRSANLRLEAVKSEAIAAGLALTPADLRRNPPTHAENAADLYRKASSAHSILPQVETVLAEKAYFEDSKLVESSLRRAGFNGAPTSSRCAKAVAAYADIFATVDEAVEMPFLDWNYRWEDPFTIGSSEYGHMKGILRAMIADADLAAKRGDLGHMNRRLQQGIQMANQVGQVPTWTDLLACRSLYALVIRGCVDIGFRRRTSPDTLKSLRAFLVGISFEYDYKKALQGETVQPLECVRVVAEDPNSVPNWPSDLPWFRPEILKLRALKIGFVRHNLEAQIIRQRLAIYKRLKNLSPRDSKAISASFTSAGRENLADEIDPAYDWLVPTMKADMPQHEIRYLVFHRLAIEFIGVLLQAKMDSWPEKYSPGLIDPFNDKPLRYLRKDDGFTLYSVWENRSDEGGNLGLSKTDDYSLGVMNGKVSR